MVHDRDNRLLGSFNLDGIPPAPRGAARPRFFVCLVCSTLLVGGVGRGFGFRVYGLEFRV